MSFRRAAAGALTVLLLSSGCGESGDPSEATTDSPMQPPPVTVIDVDPDDFAQPDSPGYYHWAYASNPLRQCAIYPAMSDRGVSCVVVFPPGTAPVTEHYSGPPNTIEIIGTGRAHNLLTEGGPHRAPTLPVGHRITVGDFTCTALADDGIDCAGPAAGFRFENGVLRTR